MESFTRDGLTFDVTDSGEGTGPNGTVVLLHGFPQTSKSWSQVIPLLNARGYRTVAPDQRGYSPGARPKGRYAYRTSEMVDDAAALIEALDVGPVHLVGHDWGGAVAWGVAGEHPELVSTLTSVSVPHPAAFLKSFLSSDQIRKSWYMLAFQPPKLPELLMEKKPDLFDKLLGNSGMDAEQLAAVHREVIDTGAFPYALNWYRGMPLGSPSTATTRVNVPTTHVWSTGDIALARRGADLAGDYVDADYELKVLDGDHWIPERHPAELTDIIVERADSVG